MAKEIPGFYYDEEKKKYFKIVQNHVAPNGSKYSREAVHKERLRKQNKKAQLQKSKSSSCVQHAPILNHVFGAAMCMDREIGIRRPTPMGSVWAYGLDCIRSLDFHPVRGSSSPVITSILKDEATGAILAGSSYITASGGNSISVWLPTPNQHNEAEQRYHEISRSVVTYDRTSDITSMCMTPARLLISTSLGGSDACGSVTLTQLYEAHEILSGEKWPLVDQGVTFRIYPKSNIGSTFFDSSANPDQTSSTTLAIATDVGVLFLKESQIHDTDWFQEFHSTNSAVFSVTWLSSSLLASGCRNGAVWLYDRRSRGNTLRLQHPSSVTHVEHADEWRLVIAGLRNNLNTYDLRFPRTSHRYLNDNNITNPYISYPNYQNIAHPSLGFDISTSLGLVAAGTDECGVKLFELWTGKDITPGWGNERKWKEMVRSLQFTGDDYEHGTNSRGESESLLLGIKGVVEEWRF